MVLLFLFLGVLALVAYMQGAGRRAVTPEENARAETIAKAAHNMVAVQFGESLAGQGAWEFGAAPPVGGLEPAGENVVTIGGFEGGGPAQVGPGEPEPSADA